jgi:K+/H+ antiporter YhaU regulatory subunit KhtT
MEEIRVTIRSPMLNKSLMDSGLRKTYNLIEVSIKRADGQSIFNPTPNIVILEGDILIVLGEWDQVNALERTMLKV